MDDQPFSISSDQSSIGLLAVLEPSNLIPSTKYFTEAMLPPTYESLKIKIQTELSEASFLFFTSDTWANSETKTLMKTSCLSLKAHCLNKRSTTTKLCTVRK